jgi:two-component system, OmpR family, sensor histidine kinase KdpD
MPLDKAKVQADALEGEDPRGKLKIFLGYAPGGGKTFSMLDEAVRRKKRGQDVVIGAVDAHNRDATRDLVVQFEVVPMRVYGYQGAQVQEMDVDGIIARKPGVVLIDDLEHRNAPGAEHPYRWQDVQELLNAGISVLTTLGVQNLESLNDKIFDITGVRVTETVPDQILHSAAEVEMVDVTPRALINRLERGDVYPAERVEELEATWFKEGTLSALREIALREIAGRVDEDVVEYRKANRIEKPWATRDRVMICVSPSRPSLRLVRRGWRLAQRMHADVIAAYVEDKEPTEEEQRILRDDFDLAERLGVKIVRLHGKVVPEIIRYVEENNVTQLVIGHSQRSKLQELRKGSIIGDLARELRNIDILVVASEQSAG